MPLPSTVLDASISSRLSRARLSLSGLAIGDAFGQTFFSQSMMSANASEALAEGPWYWTDDTAMALSIYEQLEKRHRIQQDELAAAFATRYVYDRNRGYGPGMHRLLLKIADGSDWRIESRNQFSGQGSWGNGSAMRVAPLGAYFADDINDLVQQARLSAEVTHAHAEGIAGAIAIALAAAWGAMISDGKPLPDRQEYLFSIAELTPESLTRDGIRRAALLAPGSSVRLAVEALGNGLSLSCPDTVPFVLWCLSQHLDDYEAALRLTAAGGGDVDTTCAMVGGIVVLSAPANTMPGEWQKRTEPLPQWVFVDMEPCNSSEVPPKAG